MANQFAGVVTRDGVNPLRNTVITVRIPGTTTAVTPYADPTLTETLGGTVTTDGSGFVAFYSGASVVDLHPATGSDVSSVQLRPYLPVSVPVHAGSAEFSGAPTAVSGAGADTPAGEPVITGSNGVGKVTWGTGATPSTGSQAELTFSQAYTLDPSAVLISPINAATVAVAPYAVVIPATGFNVYAAITPAQAPAANTDYGVYYRVIP